MVPDRIVFVLLLLLVLGFGSNSERLDQGAREEEGEFSNQAENGNENEGKEDRGALPLARQRGLDKAAGGVLRYGTTP